MGKNNPQSVKEASKAPAEQPAEGGFKPRSWDSVNASG